MTVNPLARGHLTGLSMVIVAMTVAGVPAALTAAEMLPGSPGAVIAQTLKDALAERGAAAGRELELDNPMLTLSKNLQAEELRIDNLAFDARTGRVAAVLAPSSGGPERLRIGARTYTMVDAVVPARPLAPGEVIAAGDLERASLRTDRTAPDAVTDSAALIGRTPRRPLRAHEAIRAADVQTPIVIRKGDLVTMTVTTPLMVLTAQGQALEDGGRGAAIRVSNSKSSRVVDAVVTGPNAVTVDAPSAP